MRRVLLLAALLLGVAAPTPGCDTVSSVRSVGGDFPSIQAAVNAVPATLTGNHCIQVDSGTYAEQVTVQNITVPAAYRLTIMSEPGMTSSATAVAPAASTAAFLIANSSVSLVGFKVVSAAAVPYGIKASSSYVTVSSVSVASPAGVFVAGVMMSSWTTVEFSSVTVGAADALLLDGWFNQVSYSTGVSAAQTGNGIRLIGASSNTFQVVFASSSFGHGIALESNSNSNSIQTSTMVSGIGKDGGFNGGATAGGYGLYINASSSNAVTGSYLKGGKGGASNTCCGASNPGSGGYGARLDSNADFNRISRSTMVGGQGGGASSFSPGQSGLFVNASSSNTFEYSLVIGADAFPGNYNSGRPSDGDGGDAVYFAGGSSGNSLYASTMTGGRGADAANSGGGDPAGTGGDGVFFSASSSNTITLSVMTGGLGGSLLTGQINGGRGGAGLRIQSGVQNTVSASSMTGGAGGLGGSTLGGAATGGAGGHGLAVESASSLNAVVRCVLGAAGGGASTAGAGSVGGAGGSGASAEGGASGLAVAASTMTGSFGGSGLSRGADGYGLSLNTVSTNTIVGSYIQGSTGVYVSAAASTTLRGNVLVGTNTAGNGFGMTGASEGLLLSLNTVRGGPTGAGVLIAGGSGGTLVLSTNTVLAGAEKGIYILNSAAGASIWLTSNTVNPTLSPTQNTMGLHLEGLLSGATVQNNGIYYRTPGTPLATAPLYVKDSPGMVIERNRMSNPGMLLGGDYRGLFFYNADNATVRFNDMHSTGTGLGYYVLFEAGLNSNGITLHGNVFSSSVTVTGSSATVKLAADSQAGFVSDYNDYFSSAAANTAQWGTARCTLPNWTGIACLSTLDADSIAAHPQWADPGAEDFHPRSQRGRYNPATLAFDLLDSVTSPTIDAGDPTEAFASEPAPNGGRVNQGSYANTAEASKSAPAAQIAAFEGVFASSVTVQFSTDSADGYLVQATSTDFSGNVLSSATTVLSLNRLTLTGLLANSTYTFRAGAVYGSATGYGNSVTTATAIEAPTAVYFDEISSRSVTASAYAPGPAFSSMTVGVSGTNIALAGNYQGWHGGGGWTAKASLLTGGQVPAAAALGGKIYVVGVGAGYTGNQIYDPVTNAWAAGAPQPTGRSRQGLAAVGGKLYSVGGYDDTTIWNANEEYDPESDSWSAKRPMPTARWALSAQALYGKVYAVGGNGGTTVNEAYDPATDTWATKQPLPGAMSTMASAVAGGKLYLLNAGANREYDPGANSWGLRAGMPSGRTSLTAVGLGGKVYAIGGSGPLKTVEVFDPGSNAWVGAPGLPTARSGLVSAAVGGRIYALAGYPNDTLNEVFDPGLSSSFTFLTPNTLYAFKAKARNAAGVETAESPTVSTYTLAVATVPQNGAPRFADLTLSSVTVYWSSGTDAGGYNAPGASYLVQMSTMASFLPVLSSSQTAATWASLTGLLAQSTHYFRVRAYNTAGVTDFSWAVLGSTADFKAPTKPPLDLTAYQSGSSNTVRVRWTPPSDDDGADLGPGSAFRLQWSTSPFGSVAWSTANAQVVIATGPVSASQFVSTDVANLPARETVVFRIWASDDFGNWTDASSSAPAFASPFSFETVAAAASGSVSLAIDRFGDQHVAYRASGTNRLTYVKRTGTAWGVPQTVFPTQADAISLAVDLDGDPHIAYSDLDNPGIAYAEFKTAWSSSTVESVAGTGGASLALDAAGNPSLTYSVYSLGALKFARRSGNAWLTEVVEDGTNNNGVWNGLALDGAGNPHVAFSIPQGSYASSSLRYATRTGGGAWSYTTVQPATEGVVNVRLALDGSGLPRVTYFSYNAPAFKQVRFNGAVWGTPSVIDSANVNSQLNAMTLDGAGNVHVAYYTELEKDLKYASSADGVSWSTQTVDSAGDAGFPDVRIAVDGVGDVHLAYYGTTAAAFKAAHWTPAGFPSAMGGNPQGAVQAPTAFRASGVFGTSVAWNWSDNAANEAGYRVYLTSAGSTDGAYFVAVSSVVLGPGSQALGLTGLTPNTSYQAYVAAVSSGGVVLSTPAAAWTLAVATAPEGGAPAFTAVYAASATVAFSSGTGTGVYNGPGALYLVQASTMATFAPVQDSSSTKNAFAVLSNLIPNGTHYFRVTPVNGAAAQNSPLFLGSTVTLANEPVSAATTFTAVSSGVLSVAWGANGNAAGTTLYQVALSTGSGYPNAFSGNRTLSTTPAGADPAATVAGLSGNTTYYLFVGAVNRSGVTSAYAALGATVTAIETPTAVYFDEVSSSAITASAYAQGTAFSSMTAGLSGAVVARDGAYDAWRPSGWSARASLTQRFGAASAALGGRLYAVGGDNFGKVGTNEAYDPVTNAWTGLTAMGVARSYAGLAAVGGRLYAFGGSGMATTVPYNEEYDPEANSWRDRRSLNQQRWGLAGAALNGKVYAIGGNDSAALKSTEEYDPDLNTWTPRGDLAGARHQAGAAVVGGKIYLAGGVSSSALEVFDPGTGAWSSLTGMSVARQTPGVAAVGGKVYVLGGFNVTYVGLVEQYDPAADAWTPLGQMLRPRADFSAAALRGRIYAVAGYDGSTLPNLDAFDPGVASTFSALTPNTLYTFKAKARNLVGAETAETLAFSTYTLAVATLPSGGTPVYGAVHAGSVTVNWSSGTSAGGYNGAGASYLVQASTLADFIPVLASSQTYNIYSTVTGLFANATHYFRVRAYNSANVTDYSWLTLGSTVTAIEAPTALYFDDVTTHSITAAAYAATPAFSSMTVGLSGANVAMGGSYAGWRGESWRNRAAMPTFRASPTGAAVGGKFYAIDGFNGGAIYSVNEAFNPALNTWASRAAAPTARSGDQGSAVLGGRIYVVGGCVTVGCTAVATNEVYDPASDSWATLTSMPTARYEVAVAAAAGKVYAFGGFNGALVSKNEAYDPETDTWASRADINPARRAAAAVGREGRIWLIGGQDGSNLARMDRYDTGTNTWTAETDMPTARRHVGAVSLGGRILAVGGSDGAVGRKENEAFDPLTGTWKTHSPMPIAMSEYAIAAVGGRVYAFKGGDGLEFDPGVASSFTALTPNTQYSFKAKTRNSIGVETTETATVSTYTLAAATAPQSGVPLFTAVNASSVTVNWSSGTDAGGYNGAGATYLVQAATVSSFANVLGSSLTANSFAAVPSLLANATHYFRVRAYTTAGAPNDWYVLGSTLTAVETPTAVLFDDVSTGSITAAAYAAGPAFTGMTVGLTGTALSINGVFASGHGEKWTAKNGLLNPRSGLAAATLGGRVYAVGGHNATYQAITEVYDPVANAWSTRASMPTARKWLAAAAVGGRLYAVGGNNGSALTANEEYDPTADTWTARAPLPVARDGLAAVAVGSRVYALGGNGATTDTTQYDPATDAWTARAAMPSGRAYLAAAVVRDKVYAVGGLGAATANEEYNPATNAWGVWAPMPTGRYLLAAAAVGGKVYALGGTSGFLSVNEEYDPLSNQWTTRTSMPTARNDLAAAAVGGRVYAVGGWTGSASGVTEEFDPGTASSFTALTPNTLYTFKAKARNSGAAETAESPAFSTYTLAAASAPLAGTEAFSPVYATSMTVTWSSGTAGQGFNGPGATYLVQASTRADFMAVAGSSLTASTAALISGLSGNATTYVRVRAYNSGGMPNDWFFLGSTVTLANPALSAASTFTMVGLSSMTVTWDGNSNVAGTRYDVVFTTYLPFTAAVTVSTNPYGTPSVTATGLLPNVTYYPLVFVYNRTGAASGETAVGSTVTRIESPTTVVIDEVSTHSIVAAAYAAAFSSMTAGLSGTNVAKDGLYQGWHGESWTARAALGVARYSLGAAASGGRLYAVGGNNGGGASGVTEEFDPVTGLWSAKASLSVAREQLAVAAAGGKLYAVGGLAGAAVSAATEEYDPAADAWTSRANLPTPRRVLAAASVGGKVYALGGFDGSTTFDKTEEFDPAANVWTAKAAMTTPRLELAAAAVGGKVYALGGGAGFLSTNEAYDPAANTWATLTAMPVGRRTLAAVGLGGRVYALGGTDGAPTARVDVFDPAGGTWSSGLRMPTARMTLAAAAVGGRIFAVGGDNGGVTGANEQYDPGVASSFTALTPNTPYAFKAKARNSVGMETPETTAVSTYTLAFATVPAAGSPAFSAVFESSVSVNWASGTAAGGYNGLGAAYLVQASTLTTFTPLAASSSTLNPSATLTGLSINATHYFRVRAYNTYGAPSEWVLLDSTVTAIEAPSTVYIEDVTSTSLVAAAYAPGPAFSSMTVGLSGTNVSLGGSYQGWHGERWTARTALTFQRHGVAAAAFGGRILAIGGQNGGMLASVEEYDPVANAWTARASMPSARQNLAAAVARGKVYALGGDDGASRFDKNEEYDPGANSWVVRAAMPGIRNLPAAVGAEGLVFVFGGFDGSVSLDAALSYDPGTDQWTARTPMPGGVRSGAAAATVGGKILVVGGSSGATDYGRAEAYDPVLGTWQTRTAMPTPRGTLGAAAVGGKVYAVGGTVASVPSSTNEVYDPQTDGWRARAAMPTARGFLGVAAVGGRIYAIGGQNAGFLSNNEEFDPGTASSFTALTPNTLYSFKAKARNAVGRETAETASVSTYTLAAVPSTATPVYLGTFTSSVTLQWTNNGNPGPTEYRLRRSTSAGLNGAADAETAWFTGTSTSAVGLPANSTFYFSVRARNGYGLETAALSLGSTVTAAALPASAASTFSAVAKDAAVVAWGANGNSAGTLYELQASSNGFADNVTVSTRPEGTPSAPVSLTPNTTWSFQVRTVSRAGVPTAYASLGSTVTLAAAPAVVAASFTAVGDTTLTVSWSGNGNPVTVTTYTVAATTGASYPNNGASNVTLTTSPAGAVPTATLSPLTSNTTFNLFVQAFNHAGSSTPWVLVGTTVTAPSVPLTTGPAFAVVDASSLTVRFDANGNATDTAFEVTATTGLPFPNVFSGNQTVSTTPAGVPQAAVTGLVANTTWYLHARAIGRSGTPSAWTLVASTITAIEAPESAFFLSVGSTALVAVASAPGGAFTALSTGASGVNIAVGGTYAGFVAGSSAAAFGSLTPNTAYAFKAKARNQVGRETSESAAVSTYTLAAVPSTATPSFPLVWVTSAGVQWTANGNPAGTEYRLNVSTAADWTGASDSTSAWFAATSTAAVGLAANTTYYFRAAARNATGAETAWASVGTTATLAAVPGAAASTFTAVSPSSLTVSWASGLNPAGTEFRAQASTSAAFDGSGDKASGWLAAFTTGFTALLPDTTYYWRVHARNRGGLLSEPLALGPQATLAFDPSASTEPFHWVAASSANVQWAANGNPAGTVYQVSASTASGFSGAVLTSGWVAFLSTTVTGLTGDSTYYLSVRARGVGGTLTTALSLGSTATLAADPQGFAAAAVGPGALRAEWSPAGNREAEPLGAWAARTSVPSAVERLGSVLVNGRLYAVGGVRGGSPSAEVWSAGVSPAGTVGAWRREADLPAPRESHALAAAAGRLYVVGGFDGSAKNSVYSAALATDGSIAGWSAEAALPAARFKLAAAASGGWLYAFGGDNGAVSQSTVYRAPLAQDGRVGAWGTGTALPAGRNSHAAAVSGGRVYVAGGLGAGVAAEVWSAPLDGPGVGPWSVQTPLAVPVFRHALLASGGALFVVGGHDGTVAVADVRSASVAADGSVGAWGSLTSLPAARFGHGAALDGSNLLVVGGADDSAAAAEVSQAALGGAEYLLERAQDAGFSVGYASSGWRAGAGADVPGLTPNTTYSLRLHVRARSGAEGAYLVTAATRTPAAVPASAASTFSLVEAGSMTLTWAAGGNPAGTEFLAALSTASDFTAVLVSSWTTAVSSAVWGLSPNTTYYAAAVARDALLRGTRELFLGSTVTAAAVPQTPSFPSVLTTGLSVAWTTAANPAGTRYEAQLAGTPSFSPVAAASVTFSSGAVFAGLQSATTYYLRVRAFNRLGTPSGYSAATWAVTGADFTPPAAATGLALHATDTPGILLAAWTAPGDDGTSGALPPGSRYYLQWSAADPASVAWSTANAQLSAATGPVTPGAPASLLVTGLTAGSSVTARVWTLDESANVSAPSATAAVWASPFTLTRLDGAGQDAGRWVSVALDRTGGAHAAYTAGTVAQELRYMTRSGGVWSVAEAPDPGVPAEEAVLAMGPSAPQVVYRNSSTGQMRLAKRGTGWTAAAVASGDLHPGGLAVDATGAAHIAYYDAALPGLRYARWNGAGWDLEAVDAGAGRGRFSSLALDGASSPHIAYYDATAADLKYASRTVGGTWVVSTLDAGVDAGSAPVVALDGNGNPAVAYIDSASKDLKLARYDGAAWSLSLIDTARDATAVRGLALDGAGKAVLTYYDGTNGDLLVGRFNGAAWDTGAVDSYGDVGAWSAVAVQSDGALLELHYDATAADLKAGTWNAGVVGALDGNPRGRAQAPAAFSGVVGSASSIQWTWIDSASDELGWRLYGSANSTGPFTVVAGTTALPATAGTGTQRLYTETGLTAGTTYYRYAAAVSSGGTVTSPMAALFPFNTTDTAAPTALDNQAGEVVWRRAAGALYNVDFQDTGGSALAKFQVKASTVPLGAGPDVAPYTDVVLNILADTYTADWALPSSVFNAMLDGATHYISVRAYDGAGNVGVSSDVFTVLKDTTPPAFGDNQNGDLTRRAAAGTLYDVDVRDPSSGLERFQYSVSTTASVPDGSVVGWTDVPLGASTTAFLSDWAVAFASLVGDAPNYVSVRAWDRAGSTAALTDAFFVLKDTGGPSVGVTAPASAFRSALTALSGTAADPGGVGGVSVAVQTAPPAGLWFDGAAFTAGGPFWLGAAGTATWTFAGVPAWTDGGSFRVVARATDTLGNLSVAYSTADFAFDVTVPTAGVAAPADGSTLSSLPNLSGAAGDRGAGLALLEVRVRRLSDGLYWSWPTEAWGASALSTSPAVAANWTLPVPEALRASLASGASYFVSVRAVDAAVPANSGSLAVGSTFTWTDATAPAAVTNLSALTGPSPGTLQLSWTAPGDDGALGNVLLGTYRIHYSTDPAAAFSTSAAQVAFSTSGVSPGLRQGRLVTGLTAGATYHVRVFLADDAGNWSSLSNGATAYAGNQPFNKILGHVMKVSSEGVTAVKIEAYDASEVRVSQTFTLADGSGTFTLENVPDGAFKVQASWTADDVTSSVWLDGVAVGSYDVDFMLEINYTLSTLTGTLASLSAQSAHPAGFLVRAAEGGFSDARVDLLRRGFPVAQVRPDPTGRWSIPNLLPGKYSVRAFNGLEYTDPQDVELGEGETREVVFVFDPLPEASVFAFPNPARSKTTFRFVSALPGLEAQVTVFDIAGTLVKEIPGSAFVAKAGGVYHADWDLTNEDGESVASGVYLFMVKVKGNNGQSGKVVKKLAVVR